MFMGLNSKCANQVRPTTGPDADERPQVNPLTTTHDQTA
jgi:hypothetical protein